MELREVTQTALVLDEDELEKLKQCFNYLYLRVTQHPEGYLGSFKLKKFISYFRTKIYEE